MIRNQGIGHAVWLVPSGEALRVLRRLIRTLSAERGAPVFQPHVTLLSGIPRNAPDPIGALRDVARTIAPLQIELGRIDHSEEYFRCLFVRVQATAALRDAHRKTRAAFGVTPPAPYLPHVSLIYGRLDLDDRRRLARSVGTVNLRFEVSRLHFYLTDGPVESWHPGASAALSGFGKPER